MKSIKELLLYSTGHLHDCGLADPRRESASLMAFAIGKDQAFLRAHPEFVLTEAEESVFMEIVGRRGRREPFQHITGKQEFYGLSFEVNEFVLIPRPETELVVEASLDLLKDIESPKICDIGTGSGCISIALLYSLAGAVATASDISSAALGVARRNALKHGVLDRLNLVESDLLTSIDENPRFDLIASNPPYVPKEDYAGLQSEVREFEPMIAVTDGFDGLSMYRRMIQEAPKYLKPGGWIVFEVGIYQCGEILGMLEAGGCDSVSLRNDLQGIPRVVTARVP